MNILGLISFIGTPVSLLSLGANDVFVVVFFWGVFVFFMYIKRCLQPTDGRIEIECLSADLLPTKTNRPTTPFA